MDNDYNFCNRHSSPAPCAVCAAEHTIKVNQQQHEDSIRRQGAKLKLAPWRTK
jgi:hypothetical protein